MLSQSYKVNTEHLSITELVVITSTGDLLECPEGKPDFRMPGLMPRMNIGQR
jgi:hypothetical protein